MAGPKILFVNHTSTIAGGELVLLDLVQAWAGASAFLFEDGPLADALRTRGLHPIVSRAGAGLGAIRRDSALLAAWPLAGRLASLTASLAGQARRHDVIYANSQKAFVLAALARPFGGRPLIWHLHDVISEAHFGRGQRLLQVTLANRFAARVVVPSAVAADAFARAGGNPDLLALLPNGIDLVPDPRPVPTLRDALGLPTGRLLGVFSRLAPWKGQHVALDALPLLPGAHLILAGDALFGETAYARFLHDRAHALGVTDRVRFLGQRTDVPLLMRACDAVIHPSVHPEPFGRTLIEAMLMRVPIIASDTGAPADILDHGAAGTLVLPGDAAALARAVARVLADPAAMAPQLDRALARARAQYGVVAMRAGAVELIGEVLRDRGTLAGARAEAVRPAN